MNNSACQITITFPENIGDILNQAASNIEQDVKAYLAVKYYLDGILTIGKAAELAGMRKMDFELFLASKQIPISLLDYSDIQADMDRMKNLKAQSA
ncbi:hypothetical protein AGMMS49991_08530 [Spirochaetia bacterium]|nr:hypothetical protein AGMMS49991_08530 [Spirochaetia bacterium]